LGCSIDGIRFPHLFLITLRYTLTPLPDSKLAGSCAGISKIKLDSAFSVMGVEVVVKSVERDQSNQHRPSTVGRIGTVFKQSKSGKSARKLKGLDNSKCLFQKGADLSEQKVRTKKKKAKEETAAFTGECTVDAGGKNPRKAYVGYSTWPRSVHR
jgi:hypothetical protein